jgi:hypothetical protein
MGVVGRWGVCVAIGAALTFLLLIAESPAAAQSALLDTLSTHVTLARNGAVDEVTSERVIRSGDTVATNRTGRALVTYPDGSTALLEESSELTVEFVRTTAGEYVVRMQQTLGRVWYAVARTVASGGRYEVHSAAMASVIRAGSGSLVAVLPGGETTVVATAGSIETSAGGTAVTVPAGASTVVSAAGTPSPPGPAGFAIAPATPSPVPSSTPETPRPETATPQTTPAATPTPAPSAAPTSAFEPAVSTLPPLPVLTAMAKTTQTAAPTPTPTQTASPTGSHDPSAQTAATAVATATAKPSQNALSTAAVKLVTSTARTVEPNATPRPTAAPTPATATPKRAAKDEKG